MGVTTDKLLLTLPGADAAVLEVLIEDAVEYLAGVTHQPRNRVPDSLVRQLVTVMYNRMGSEGLASESYSGVAQTFIDGIPKELQAQIKAIRKVAW
ncbi:MAG: phage head-tail connector protein [Peptococcaceae bacterium]|jgi:hypothetical protein|nr:phage head-tail connector protein [Peptococcaceae bacterium]